MLSSFALYITQYISLDIVNIISPTGRNVNLALQKILLHPAFRNKAETAVLIVGTRSPLYIIR